MKRLNTYVVPGEESRHRLEALSTFKSYWSGRRGWRAAGRTDRRRAELAVKALALAERLAAQLSATTEPFELFGRVVWETEQELASMVRERDLFDQGRDAWEAHHGLYQFDEEGYRAALASCIRDFTLRLEKERARQRKAVETSTQSTGGPFVRGRRRYSNRSIP